MAVHFIAPLWVFITYSELFNLQFLPILWLLENSPWELLPPSCQHVIDRLALESRPGRLRAVPRLPSRGPASPFYSECTRALEALLLPPSFLTPSAPTFVSVLALQPHCRASGVHLRHAGGTPACALSYLECSYFRQLLGSAPTASMS